MKSETFKGKDKSDLDKKESHWRSANPELVVKIIHPDENLPADLTNPTGRFAKKTPAPDLLTRRIEYEDGN